MKEPKLGTIVDPAVEARAIVSFIGKGWSVGRMTPDCIANVVLVCYRVAEQLMDGRVEKYYHYDPASDRQERVELGEVPVPTPVAQRDLHKHFSSYDNLVVLADALSSISMRDEFDPHQSLPFLIDVPDLLYRAFRDKDEGFDDPKPKEYGLLLNHYTDYDGMEELDERLLGEVFEGHEFCGTRSFPLPIAISTPHVVYGHICQSVKPMKQLVASIFSHFMYLHLHNNTSELQNELEAIDWDGPVDLSDFIEPTTPWLSRVWKARPEYLNNRVRLTEDWITAEVKRREAFMRLPQEQRDAIIAERKVQFGNTLDEVLAESDRDFEKEMNDLTERQGMASQVVTSVIQSVMENTPLAINCTK